MALKRSHEMQDLLVLRALSPHTPMAAL